MIHVVAGNDTLGGRVFKRPRILKCAALGLIALAWPTVVALAGQPPIERRLRAVLTSLPHADARSGACVIDLNTQETVFTQRANESFVPASTMKLFVMAAALMQLGPGFSFETVFATDETNLYVIGDGDPAFGDGKLHRARGETIYADFDRWAQTLLERGSTDIPGDLIIDESVFDNEWVHPSWEKTDLDNWYAAPVGGLNFNDNCIDITVSPASKPGALTLVLIQPETSLVRIVNKCHSGGGATPILHHRYDSFEYRVSGRCDKRWAFAAVSFPDPGLLFADSLRSVLTRKGIHVRGTLRRRRVRNPDGTLPSSLTVLAIRTTPIVNVLRRIGKDSQNLFAEALLKRIGYSWAGQQDPVNVGPTFQSVAPSGKSVPQGSWSLGAEAIRAAVRRGGIDETGLVIADGSGLSRDNRCTPTQLAELLAWMHREQRGGMFFDNLSVAGVDGSLRKRLKDMPGRVHAKTGTMSGVRALAGYVGDDNGPRYAFAVLFNGYRGPSSPYKQRQDRFCRILAGRPAKRGRH